MNTKNIKQKEKLLKISEEFYDLIVHLKKEKFDFCAYVTEQAYALYMTELEKKLEAGLLIKVLKN